MSTSDQSLFSFISSFNSSTIGLSSSALETPSNLLSSLFLGQKTLPKVSLFQAQSFSARHFSELERSPFHCQTLRIRSWNSLCINQAAWNLKGFSPSPADHSPCSPP